MTATASAAPKDKAVGRKRLLPLVLASLTLMLAACQSNPLGMSDEEWARLTPEQQMQARMKQADIRKASAERRAEARRQKAMLAAEERRRIERIYASARFGDILECVVEGGLADFRPGWRGYDPAPFTLVRGETKSVPLRERGKGNRKFWTHLSADGLEVSVCARSGRGSRSRYCTTVSARSNDYSFGISRPIAIDHIFQNARLVCAFRPGPGMPRRVIHQHNVEIRRVIHVHHHGGRKAAAPDTRYHRDQRASHQGNGERVIVAPVIRERALPPSDRPSTRPERQERRKAATKPGYQRNEPEAPAPDAADGYEYTPANAPDPTQSHPAPDAGDQAPDGAEHADGEAENADEPAGCEDAHPSRGRGLAKGRDHAKGKGRGNRPNCLPDLPRHGG